MTKLEEMWAALATYQPEADAAGHGESWAKMCSEKTADAADYAAYAAEAVAAEAGADYSYAPYATYAARDAAANADAAVRSRDAAAYAAQRAIDKINKAKEIK